MSLVFLETEKKLSKAKKSMIQFIIDSHARKQVRASPKYVKCPKKDSVIKVSLESDLLFSVEI